MCLAGPVWLGHSPGTPRGGITCFDEGVTVFVGTSGWQYKDWRDVLYPEGVPQRLWLEEYASGFATVESNNAFYRLPSRETFAQWRRRTPEGFVMAVKASRFLTHIKRLRDPEEPVARLMEHAAGLGDRLGPVLLQLPPTLKADATLLDDCLRCFPAGTRVAVEPRHDSWWVRRSVRSSRHAAPPCAGRTCTPGPQDRCGGPATGAICGCTRAGPSPGRVTAGRPCRPGWAG